MSLSRTFAALLTLSVLALGTGCAFEAPPEEPKRDVKKDDVNHVVISERRITISKLEHLDRIGELLDATKTPCTVIFAGTRAWDEATLRTVEAWLAARPYVSAIFEAE